ncbi:MAG: hypothetical protein BMS9Abin26_1337 [Gammaproteobacteria bacterium]|nr:MAG: hypothetical protein BMS9Abin26_1337 [Gammaproteobacteria bacterium]
MHPAIRILSFLVLVGFLARPVIATLLLAGIIVAAFYMQHVNGVVSGALGMLRRVRWLLLSIFILYLWFTPGRALFTVAETYQAIIPTVEGLDQGIRRLLALVLIVLAVNLMLIRSEKTELLSGLIWLLWPLKITGLSTEQLSVRLLLTVDYVTRVKELVSKEKQSTQLHGKFFNRGAMLIANIYRNNLALAESEPLQEINLPVISSPPVYQWSYPLIFAGIFLFVQMAG